MSKYEIHRTNGGWFAIFERDESGELRDSFLEDAETGEEIVPWHFLSRGEAEGFLKIALKRAVK